MKKLIVSILAIAASAVAFALPNPSQIEDALAAHDYNTAKSLTQEVLRAKPESARAHLFNAYVMLKADSNPQGAAAELKTAQSLDKNHAIQNTALFGRTVTELQSYKPRAVAKAVNASLKPVVYDAHKDNSMTIAVILCGTVLVIILVAFLWDNRTSKVVPATNYSVRVRAYDGGGNAAQPSEPVQNQTTSFSFTPPASTPAPQAYAVQTAPIVQTVRPEPAVQMQPSFGNRVASTAAGVVAGELAADALRSAFSHKRHSSYDDDEYEARRKKRREEESQNSYDSAPNYSSSYTDSSEDRSSYSSGSSSSWDSGSSSSSYDSGSSSWDSGSSYDSGSSSSSWD